MRIELGLTVDLAAHAKVALRRHRSRIASLREPELDFGAVGVESRRVCVEEALQLPLIDVVERGQLLQ